jgi:PAS domain S-box-containing protein
MREAFVANPEHRSPSGPHAGITESTSALLRSRQAETLYHALFNEIADAVFVVDRQTRRFVDCNEAAVRQYGYSREEFLSMSPLELHLPEDRAFVQQRIAESAGGISREYTHRTRDGGCLRVEVNSSVVNYNGRECLLSVVHDISARLHAEQASRESEAQFRAMAETAAASIAIYQNDKFIYANPACEALTGYTRQELRDMNFWDVAHPEMREIVRLRGKQRQAGKISIPMRYELKIIRKNGDIRWLDFTADAIEFAGSRAVLLTGFDTTERREAEQNLQVQKAYLEQLFESAPEGIAVIDAEGKILRINREFTRMFGYMAAEAEGKIIYELVVPGNGTQEAMGLIRRAIEVGPSIVEGQRQRKDGTLLAVSLLIAPILLSRGQTALYAIYRDISERKQAEARLRESESQFRVMAETAGSAIFIYQGDKFLYVNPATEAMTGYSRQELLQMNFWDITHPDMRDLIRQRGFDRQAGKSDVPARYEIKIVRKDREVRWIDFAAGVISVAGHLAGLGSGFDITERKRAQQLQSALYRIAETARLSSDLQQLYTSIHAILSELMYAKNCYIAYYDPAANMVSFPYFVDEYEAFAAPRSGARGVTEYVLRTGEPLLANPQMLAELESRGEVERIGQPSLDWMGVPLKKGTETFGVLVLQTYEPNVRYGEKEKQILSFVSQQIANAIEIKRNEEALRSSEARYRSLVQSAVYGIYLSSIDDKFLDVNPALVSMLGYDRAEELLPLALARDVFVNPEEHARMIEQYRHSPRVEGVEVKWRRKDGRQITVRLSGRAIIDHNGQAPVFEMIAEDVTERLALEEQLRRSQRMEAVGRLGGGIAHDFNNLLTVIRGNTELLLEEVTTAHLRAEVDEIRKAADRATDLTKQLLAFSRQQVLAPKVFELSAVISNMEGFLRRLLGSDVELSTQSQPDLGRVKADPGQIEQVIMNLAVNARDAMPHGGRLAIELNNVPLDEKYAREHPDVVPGNYVMMQVTDSGVGMDQATCSRIFEPFFTTKPAGQGTGLGLSTVYGIVQQSGGHIWVDSEIGKGTAFRIYLPQVTEPAGKISHRPGEHEATPKGTETVLLVEDEDGVRELVKQVLIKHGYKVISAAEGEEALRMCANASECPDLLLTDVVLKSMNGGELAQLLISRYADLKVLYMSGYSDDAVEHRGVFSDNSAFLQKPFSTSALMQKIREVLDGPSMK